MTEIDAHCHFWTLARGDYGWLEGEGGPLARLRRDFTPDDLADDLAANLVGHHGAGAQVIAVQAAPTTAETDFLLGLPSSSIAGVVGWADLSAEGIAGHLSDRAINPRFRGIRPMLQDIAETDWLLTAPRPEAIAALARLNLTFDALVTTRHLPVLAEFAAQNPTLAIVIDHAAKPPLAQTGAQSGAGMAEWQTGMARLAADPRISCKLSGLLTEMSPAQLADPVPVLAPIVARLLEWFGPSRLIWGSDWPVLTLAGNYGGWHQLTGELLAELSSDERAAIMGGNARRFYGVAA